MKDTTPRPREARKLLRFDPLGHDIIVILSEDVITSIKRFRKDYEGNCEACLMTCKEQPGVVWLFYPFDVKPGMVAHEAWHAVRYILRYLDAELDNEIVAYHLEYLVDGVHAFVKKQQEIHNDQAYHAQGVQRPAPVVEGHIEASFHARP